MSGIHPSGDAAPHDCRDSSGSPIQRAWRDVHAMQAHAGTNLERAAAVFGRSEFGLPPIDIRF